MNLSKIQQTNVIPFVIIGLFAAYLTLELIAFTNWLRFFLGSAFQETVNPLFIGYSGFWQQFGYSIPRMLFVFLAGWVIFILYKSSFKKKELLLTFVSLGYPRYLLHIKSSNGMSKLLVIACLIAILISVVPYLPTINPKGNPVGVDYPIYAEAIDKMKSLAGADAIYFAFSQDRPVVIILFYFLQTLVNFDEILKIAPVIISLANVISLYFLAKEITLDKKTAGICAIVEAVSLHVIVGIGAGFFANWLAFALLNVALTLVIRALRKHNLSLLICGSFVLSMTVLIHAWTWFFALAVFIVFVIANLVTKLVEKRNSISSPVNSDHSTDPYYLAKYVFVLIGINLVVDLCVFLLIPSNGSITPFDVLSHQSGSEAGFKVLQYFKLSNALFLNTALEYSFTAFMGGALASFLLISLSFFGLGNRAKFSLISYRLIVSWLIVSIFGIIFAPIEPVEFLFMWTQSRFIYFLPLSILAGIGMISLYDLIIRKFQFQKIPVLLLSVVMLPAIILNLVNTAIEKLIMYIRI